MEALLQKYTVLSLRSKRGAFMSDEKKRSVKLTGIKIFLFLAFLAIGYLAYKNYELTQKLEYYVEYTNEFHNNLYAQVDGFLRDGAHTLSISDVYYRKYFKSEDKK